MNRARMSSPSARAAVAGDSVGTSGAAVASVVADSLLLVVSKMNRARISSPSARAAVAGDKTADEGVVTILVGPSALAPGVPASSVRLYAPAAKSEVRRRRFMVPLLVSWDGLSLI